MTDPELPMEGWDACLASLSKAIEKAGGNWEWMLRQINLSEITAKELLRLLAPNHIRFVFEKPIGQISFYAIRFVNNGRMALLEDFDVSLDKMGGWLRPQSQQVMWTLFANAAKQAKALQKAHEKAFGQQLKLAIISFDSAYNILGETVV